MDSTPTSVMIEELKAAGVKLPDEVEQQVLAKKLCGWLEEYRKTVLGQNSKPSWFNL